MDGDNDYVSPQQVIKSAARLLNSGAAGVLITVLDGDNVGSKLLVEESGKTIGQLGNLELDQSATSHAIVFLESRHDTQALRVSEFAPSLASNNLLLLFEKLRPEPQLVICGAGHVGASLATLASFVGYRVTLIDDRAEFLLRERFPQSNIQLTRAENWTEAVSEAIGDGRGVSVAVVTRGHNEDEECMRAVVRTNPDYVGLIGSKRRTTIVIDRLREAGAPEQQLAKIHAPVGLDIGAVSPEEVALAIIAEVVGERRGGKGGSLSEWRRRSK
jgi:xanthine dehydrogenase accessory factor